MISADPFLTICGAFLIESSSLNRLSTDYRLSNKVFDWYFVMSNLRVHLFGKFRIEHDNADGKPLAARKCRSIFYFMLLYKNRPHLRDNLAALIWSDLPLDQSRKHLRQALWQLQKSLSTWPDPVCNLIITESDWMQINPDTDVWVDAIEFEQRYIMSRGQEGHQLQEDQALSLQASINLYTADLLENCQDEWCVFERERLQQMYLAMLDKLMVYHVNQGEYDLGIELGLRSLNHNPVREKTYRRLMRLYYLNGDRPAALHLYALCKEILKRELMLEPSAKTFEELRQIRDGELSRLPNQPPGYTQTSPEKFLNSSGLVKQLRGFQSALIKMQQEVEVHIRSLERPLR